VIATGAVAGVVVGVAGVVAGEVVVGVPSDVAGEAVVGVASDVAGDVAGVVVAVVMVEMVLIQRNLGGMTALCQQEANKWSFFKVPGISAWMRG